MSVTAYPTLLAELKDDKFRHAYMASSVRHWIALQVRALRKKKFDSQENLAAAVNTTASVISRYENPSYGKPSVQTLLELAAAFDVALIVKFATFGELAQEMEDMSDEALLVPSFSEELIETTLPKTLADEIRLILIPHTQDQSIHASAAYTDALKDMQARETGLGSFQPKPIHHSAMSTAQQ